MSQPEYFEGEKVVFQKADLKRARLVAILLSLATFVSIIFFVFAYIQKAQADAAWEEVGKLKIELAKQVQITEQNRQMAQAAKEEADRQRIIAVETEKIANEAKVELAMCKKSK